MTETQNQSPVTENKVITDVNEPSLSFADYQKLRRGEKVEVQSAPEPKKAPEQKQAKESETLETEAKEESDVDSEESDESSDEGKDKAKKKGGFQRKIDKMTARQRAAEQEIEYWKSQALKGASEPKKEEPAKQAAQSQPEGEPNPDDFETHKEYVKAVAKWTVDQERKAAKIEEEKNKARSEQEKVFKSYIERKAEFAKKTEDFDDAMEAVKDIPVSISLQSAILESDFGPQIAYELAKNRPEFERIAKLGPIAAAREIGKIEAKLSSKAAEEKQETKKITSAPKPIEPVGSTKGAMAKSIDDPEISFKEYERLRREQMKRR